MNKKLTSIIILSGVFVCGVMCAEDKVLKVADKPNIKNDEISPKEALELVNRNIATDEAEVEILEVTYGEMTLAELGEVEYKKLNKDPLIEFATACGFEIGDESKNDMYDLIADVDFRAEE